MISLILGAPKDAYWRFENVQKVGPLPGSVAPDDFKI